VPARPGQEIREPLKIRRSQAPLWHGCTSDPDRVAAERRTNLAGRLAAARSRPAGQVLKRIAGPFRHIGR
jgi:hypothetical protein